MKSLCLCSLTFLSILSCQAADTITNAVDLLPCLGKNGKSGIPFDLSVEVVRGTALPYSQSFYAKSRDRHLGFVDNALWPNKLLSAGDILRVTGQTTLFKNSVTADCLTIEITGHAQPTPPFQTTIKSILQGKHPYQLVRTHGTVTDAFNDEIDSKYIIIVIAASGEEDHGSVSLSVPTFSNALDRATSLIGAEVDITGTFTPDTRGLRKIGRSEIDLRSFSDINVTKPPPADPFSVPTIDDPRHTAIIENLANTGRRRFTGSVVAIWQKNHVLVKDDSGNVVKATLANTPAPNYGDSIILVGLPETDLFHINLRRAIWKAAISGHKPICEPIQITADDLLTDGKGNTEIKAILHGQAISLVGSIISLPAHDGGDGRLHIRSGAHTIAIDTSSTPAVQKDLELGCTIRATGTCVVKTANWRPNEPLPRIEEVFVVTRTPEDIITLSTPPWWTTDRLFTLIAVLFATLLAFLLWNFTLQHISEKKSRALVAAELDNITSKLKVDERTRIAVELHDSIAQNLTGVSLEIDSAEQLATKNPVDMMKHLRIAARTLQSCRNELRNCLWDLRSRALEENDLNEAIRRAIAPQISDINLTIRFNVPRMKLTDDIAHVLMRIVRELAINAVRHGNAKSVWIAGSLDGDRLLFSVRDDGSGFDPDTRPGVLQGHFGLQGIHERVNQFNGTMEIASTPGHGAKITISLNIPAKEQT